MQWQQVRLLQRLFARRKVQGHCGDSRFGAEQSKFPLVWPTTVFAHSTFTKHFFQEQQKSSSLIYTNEVRRLQQTVINS